MFVYISFKFESRKNSVCHYIYLFQIQKLPPAIPDTKDSKNASNYNNGGGGDDDDDNGMRIAWRYNNLNKVDSEQGNKSQRNAYVFDLTQSIDEQAAKELDVTIFGSNTLSTKFGTIFRNSAYSDLLEKLKNRVANDKAFHAMGPQSAIKKNLLRICIESLASPLWYDENFIDDLFLFLTILKATVRSSLSVCCITMPVHLLNRIVSYSKIYRVYKEECMYSKRFIFNF